MPRLYHILIMSLALSYLASRVVCDICQQRVCEFRLDIRKVRTMSCRTRYGMFDVSLNGTKLQIAESDYQRKEDFPCIGDVVEAADIITADGYKPESVITVNHQFPGPTLEVMEGAQVVITVNNHMMSVAISIHWHGLHQRGTPWMDGTPNINQCIIPPGGRYTYRFKADPAGTHWYHDHLGGSRMDGLFGLFIIHKRLPTIPYFTVNLLDWVHASGEDAIVESPFFETPWAVNMYQMIPTIDRYVDGNGITLAKFVSALINGRGRYNEENFPLHHFVVASGRTYRFHMAHAGSEFPFEVSIDEHVLKVVASDGGEITPFEVDSIMIFPGETIDFEIVANQPAANYWFRANVPRKGTDGMSSSELGGKAVLRYNESENASDEDPVSTGPTCSKFKPCKVFNCPYRGYPASLNKECINIGDIKGRKSIYGPDVISKYGLANREADVEYFFNFGFSVGPSVNSRVFVSPKAPLFGNHSELILPCDDTKCEAAGCDCTYIKRIPYNKTIQIVFTNLHPGKPHTHHPIHVHGHDFAVLRTGHAEYNKETGAWVRANQDIQCDSLLCGKPSWNNERPSLNFDYPPIKNTVLVPARGYVVTRFRSDNHGYWLVHCHQHHHLIDGMAMVLQEGNSEDIKAPPGTLQCLPELPVDYEPISHYEDAGKETFPEGAPQAEKIAV